MQQTKDDSFQPCSLDCSKVFDSFSRHQLLLYTDGRQRSAGQQNMSIYTQCRVCEKERVETEREIKGWAMGDGRGEIQTILQTGRQTDKQDRQRHTNGQAGSQTRQRGRQAKDRRAGNASRQRGRLAERQTNDKEWRHMSRVFPLH